jgi:hypothetical protein
LVRLFDTVAMVVLVLYALSRTAECRTRNLECRTDPLLRPPVRCSVFGIQCLHASQKTSRRGRPEEIPPSRGVQGGVHPGNGACRSRRARFVQPFQDPEAKHRSRSFEQYSCQWRYAWKGKLDGAIHLQRGSMVPQTVQDPNWFLLLCIATHHGMPRGRGMGARSRRLAFSAAIRTPQPEDNDGLL